MVAVRLARLAVPDLKVKVAVPSVPVVAVDALTIPVSADKDTTMPGSAAFEALSAVMVMIVGAELSDGTVVDEAESCREEVVGLTTTEVPVGVVPIPLPQPARIASAAANTRGNIIIFRLNIIIFRLNIWPGK